MKKIVTLLFGLLLVGMSMGVRAEDAAAPDALIKSVVQDVLDVMRQDKEIRSGNQKRIFELVDAKILPHFDFERMTRNAVGKAWRNATPEQKKAVTAAFHDLLVRTYVTAFSGFHDQTVEVKPFKMPADNNPVMVRTLIKRPGGQPISVDYEMRKTDAGWKAVDFVVEGADMVINYRGQFDSQADINGVIKLLTEKNQAAAASQKAGSK